ncbi:tetratricopeptide repeat protein [bacterium]|nr:tetratricopeptide repeat protein [bacterium]
MKVNEEKLIEAYGKGAGSSNRNECPSAEILFELASNNLAKAEKLKWIQHISRCRECSSETRVLLASAPPVKRVRIVRSSVLTIAASIILLLAGGLYLYKFQREQPYQRVRIAFLDPRNNTNNQQLNAIAAMLSTSLEQSSQVQVISRAMMVDAAKRSGQSNVRMLDEAAVQTIKDKFSPTAIAFTTIEKDPKGIAIHVNLKDVKTGKQLYSGNQKARDLASVPFHLDEISRSLRSHLEEDQPALRNSKRISELTTENMASYYHYFKGEDLLNRLSFREAEAEFEQAVQMDPTFAIAHYKLAFARWTSGEPARDAIAKAMKFKRKALPKEQKLIRAYSEYINGKPHQALRIYRSVLQTYPEEKETLYMAGDVSFHGGDYATAESYLRKVLELDPAYGLAYDHLILIYEGTNRYEPLAHLAQKFVQNVGSERSYKLYADALNLRGEFEASRHTYETAKKIFTSSTMPLIGIAEDVLVFQNRFPEAESTVRALLSKSEDTQRQAYRSLTRILVYQGKYREALEASNHVVELDRKSKDSQNLARAYAQRAFWLLTLRGDQKGFEIEMNNALKADTHHDDFLYIYLFQNYLLAGRIPEAEQIARENILDYGFYPDMLKAFDARKKRDHQQAIRVLNDLETRGEPWSRILRTRELALAYNEKGDYPAAYDTFEKLKTTFSNYLGHRAVFYPEALYYQGVLLEKMGDKQKAHITYTNMTELWKNADSDIPFLKQVKSRLSRSK